MQGVRDIWHAEAECIKEKGEMQRERIRGRVSPCRFIKRRGECLLVYKTRAGTARFAFTPLVLSTVVAYNVVNAKPAPLRILHNGAP